MSGGDGELDRLEALFEEAMGMRPGEREAFLEARVGDEPEVLEELRSLLEHAATDPEFLDRLGEQVVRPRAGEALRHARHERLAEALKERYRLVRLIGRGGMATVYLADDLRHGRRVAVKVLDPDLTVMLGAERFLAEIRTTAKLQHPHILPLFDSGEAEGLLYYVMPYVEGESLRARLDRERQLPVDEAVAIASAVAEALDYAHRHSVVHRDLKPGNVLLHEGRPLLMDFGIALAMERAEGGERLTQTGRTLGTPLYMSPEQATGQEVGSASDLYSLGCLLHEMLLGEPPHTAPTRQAVLARIITDEVAPLTEQRRSVPPHVDAVVRRALEKLPADRFRSGEALAAALQDPGFRHDPAGRAAATRAGRHGWMPSGRGWTPAAGAAVAVVAVALGWWALGPGGGGLLEGEGPAAAGTDPVDAGTSLAVLPFRDLSPSSAHAYLGEGIAEELINALTKIPELRVMARYSAFSLPDLEPREAARRLGVGAILIGSYRQEGDSVRINAQLIDGETGFNHWSDQYDRSLESVIAIQEQIARAVAQELRVELLGGGRRLVSADTRVWEAYELYMLGRHHWNQRTLDQALAAFQEAVELDPSFALAYSGLADAYILQFEYGNSPATVAIPLARAAAERALVLDSTLAEAHTSLAEVLAAERRWAEADRQFRTALRLNPGYLTANHWYGWMLAHIPMHDAAIAWLERAKVLDPLSAIVRRDLADAYFIARRYDDAIAEAEICQEMQIGSPRCATAPRMMSLELSGRLDEALEVARERSGPAAGRPDAHDARLQAKIGRHDLARAELERWWALVRSDSLTDVESNPNVHVRKALIHLALGEQDAALDALDRAIDLGLGVGYPFRDWPMLDDIRDHPRHRAQLERMDYPDPPLRPLLPDDLADRSAPGDIVALMEGDPR